MNRDIVFECAFYGRTVRQMGCMYYRPADTRLEDAELYFAAMYLSRLLASRYITFQTAVQIQTVCSDVPAIEAALEKGRIGEGRDAVEIMDYHAGWTCGLSASMLDNDKKTFRFGHIGFGWFFKNKKKIAFCCQMSVYGLCDTLLKVRRQDEALKRRLSVLLESMGKLELGKDLYQGNYKECARRLYEKALRV